MQTILDKGVSVMVTRLVSTPWSVHIQAMAEVEVADTVIVSVCTLQLTWAFWKQVAEVTVIFQKECCVTVKASIIVNTNNILWLVVKFSWYKTLIFTTYTTVAVVTSFLSFENFRVIRHLSLTPPTIAHSLIRFAITTRL